MRSTSYKTIKIAIVGRSNVGKSSLFNAICRKRISICHEQEGVTRDRIYGETDFFGKPLILIDTGGMCAKEDSFQKEIEMQALLGAEQADVVIFVVDGRAGVTALDEEVKRLLCRLKKPLLLAVNKLDNEALEASTNEFYSLGISTVVAVSALQNRGIETLLEKVIAACPPLSVEESAGEKEIFIAILGRSNVGKSTLLNSLFQKERSLVSEQYATTRDPVDASFVAHGKKLTFIDTAGIRRKKSQKNPVEKFADIRTQSVLKKADVCLFLIDATEGLTTEEKKIAAMIERSGKGCILLCNKWDLVSGFRQEHCLRAIRTEAPFLAHLPSHFISAKMQTDFSSVLQSIFAVHKNLSIRISTGELNRFLEKTMQKTPPPRVQGKRLKVYYMTQVSSHPVRFVFFVNCLLFSKTYIKHLVNQFRKQYSFAGVPLQFHLKVDSTKKRKSTS